MPDPTDTIEGGDAPDTVEGGYTIPAPDTVEGGDATDTPPAEPIPAGCSFPGGFPKA